MDYRKELLKDILPFWLKKAIDYENGGIYTQVDKKGAVFGSEKSVWFQGRALWTFSKAYNTIDKKPEFLKAAKCIFDFLPRCVDSDGRMFFTVTKEGKPLQKRRYYFSETFAAIGCAEYYKATNDPSALVQAEKYFDTAYKCFTGEIKNTPKINPENCNLKALSPVMIMLSTAQTMRSIESKNKEKYNRIAKDCLEEILNGGFLTEKALLESVGVDKKSVNSPSGRVVNPGHSMEAAWFVMLEGVLTNNEEAIRLGKKIIDVTLPLGLDKKHGGLIAFTDVLGEPPLQLEWDMKLWWPQCETIIALKLASLIFNDKKYVKLLKQFEKYCEKHFVDKTDGEWYGYLHYDNTVSTTLKGNIFKGPFHVPRLYMIMAILNETGSITDYAK